jgi:heptosyltransferase-1
LIVRLGAMGDVLHALPAVTALRAVLPASWIGWAIEPHWKSLLCAESATPSALRGPDMPVVDVLHPVPAKRWARSLLSPSTLSQVQATRSVLRAQHYDICIDLQGAVRSAWIGRMAAASRMIGEAHPREPLARWLFHERVETTGIHVIEQAYEVVAAAIREITHEKLSKCPAALPIDGEAEGWCDRWLAERNIERFVLLNPGAGWGAKRWPIDRYADVALELAKFGYATVVNVGPGESGLAEAICANPAARAFAMSGSIGQLIACTRRASLFIGGDTGPLHLAAALEIPVAGIYGPTDPARNGPYGTRALILRHPASQRDHSRRKKPEAGLLTITVKDVLHAARELLEVQTKSLETFGPA